MGAQIFISPAVRTPERRYSQLLDERTFSRTDDALHEASLHESQKEEDLINRLGEERDENQ
jgi:hypothetical protein